MTNRPSVILAPGRGALFLFLVVTVASEGLAQSQPAFQTEVYTVAPTRQGGKELKMDIYLPEEQPIKGAVILAHGGAFATGARDIFENRTYGKALAERGYLAAAISYRLVGDAPVPEGWATAYAMSFRESEHPLITLGFSRYGPDIPDAAAVASADVISAMQWLRDQSSRFGFDGDNISLFGASAGAIASLTVAYAMDEYGTTSPVRPASVISLRGALLPDIWFDNLIESSDPPLMILHGEIDKSLDFPEFAEPLFKSAREVGLPVEMYTAPDYGHELGGNLLLDLRISQTETVLDRIDSFLMSTFESAGEGVRNARSRLETDILSRTHFPHLQNLEGLRAGIATAALALIDSVEKDSQLIDSLYHISRRELLLHDLDDPSRTDWSYWPRNRSGLPLRYMTAQQRMQVQDMLALLLSAKGYLQVNHVMALEEVLATVETVGFSRGSEDYTVAVFGTPMADEPWGLRFEGHHLSLNVLLAEESISVTPSFMGASPATIQAGPRAGFNALLYEENWAFSLLHSLDEDQRKLAILSEEAPSEIFSGQYRVEREQWDRWQGLMERDGLPASSMDIRQFHLFRMLLWEITNTYRTEISSRVLAAMDPRALVFSWMGATEQGKPHYFRIQGEHFVFELDAAQEGGNHIHTVWRDREGDFGEGLLSKHYRSHNH